ncbi:calpain-A-like [Diprion similis]|uniref:calpain-A-like n=1 Tax=Diprion similis TaxID=362088 RepID=UPI001EF77508|nr:calpain-A-like [Diprion similis]
MSNTKIIEVPENDSQENEGASTSSPRINESRRGNVSKLGESPLHPEPNDATQVFLNLKQECLSEQVLFEDPKFPAADSSLFPSGIPTGKFSGNVVWKRPKEIVSNPQFFVDGVSRFDAKQRDFSDCWVIAALSSLAMRPKLLYKVVPKDQSFQEDYAGIFHFRFWRYGKWVDVVIDDRLPTDSEGLVCARSSDSNEFWTSLVAKAYAKLYGSWEAIEYGQASEALEDFTGGISVTHPLNDPQRSPKFPTFHHAQKRRALIACQSKSRQEPIFARGIGNIDSGIVGKHVYSVVEVSNYKGFELLRLRNPWGNEAEWRGPFRDSDEVWIDEDMRKALNFEPANDGEFYIPFKRMLNHFSLAHICYPDFQSMFEDKCNLVSFEGKWVRRELTAGVNDRAEILSRNRQFFVTLEHLNDLDGKRKMFIAVMQKNRRMKRAPYLEIGFEVYQVKDADQSSAPLGIDFFRRNKPVDGSGSGPGLREVYNVFKLEPGVYCVIPSIYAKIDGRMKLVCNEEEEFLLRVWFAV